MAINPVDTRSGADLVRAATRSEDQPLQQPTAAVDAVAATTAANPQHTAKSQPDVPELATLDNNRLRFQVDTDSGKTVAQLVDTHGHVLRQIPTEEAIELAKALDKYAGMFVDRKV